jgi:hypothetical protein
MTSYQEYKIIPHEELEEMDLTYDPDDNTIEFID